MERQVEDDLRKMTVQNWREKWMEEYCEADKSTPRPIAEEEKKLLTNKTVGLKGFNVVT